MKKRVFFDTDPGINHVMAILFAQATGKIELLGITTVFGDAIIENASRNTLYLKQRFAVLIRIKARIKARVLDNSRLKNKGGKSFNH
jgi:inosine-uridine nucleoside N-ribohydrolase